MIFKIQLSCGIFLNEIDHSMSDIYILSVKIVEDIYTHMEFCDLYDKHLFLDSNIDYVSIVCMAKCLAYHSWPTMLHGIII